MAIATSTMESEYVTLLMALRAAIPLIEVCTAINTGLNVTYDKLLTFKAIVHEDNMGALTLAQLDQDSTPQDQNSMPFDCTGFDPGSSQDRLNSSIIPQ